MASGSGAIDLKRKGIQMTKYFIVLISAVLLGASAHGFAQISEVPNVDPLAQLLLLIRDWQAMGPLALGMAVVIFLVQVIKRFAPGFRYSRTVVTILSVAYALLMSVSTGSTWLEAGIAVLIVGGGAVAIYEAFKGMGKALLGK
jgi:hypothetical protein